MQFSYQKIVLLFLIITLSFQYSKAENYLDVVRIIKKNKNHYLVKYFDHSKNKNYCIFNHKKVLLLETGKTLPKNSLIYGEYACRSPLNDGKVFCSFKGKDSLNNEVNLYTQESNDSVLWTQCD